MGNLENASWHDENKIYGTENEIKLKKKGGGRDGKANKILIRLSQKETK